MLSIEEYAEALGALECATRGLDIKTVKNPKSGKLLDESGVRNSYERLTAGLEAMCAHVIASHAMAPMLLDTLYSAIGMEALNLNSLETKEVASGADRPDWQMHTCMGCSQHCDERLRALNFFGKKFSPFAFAHSPAFFERHEHVDRDWKRYKQLRDTVVGDAKTDSTFMTCESTGVSQRFNDQDGGIWALGPCCYGHANLVFFLRALVPRLASLAEIACVECEKRGEPCSDDQLCASTQGYAEHVLEVMTRATETCASAQNGRAISWSANLLNAITGPASNENEKAFWDAVHEMQNVRFEPGTNEAFFKSRDLKERGRLAHNPERGCDRFVSENPTMRQCATSGSSAKRPAREDDVHAGSSSSSSSKTPRLGGVGLIQRMGVVESHLGTGFTVLADQISSANRILGITPSAYSSFPDQVSAIEEVLGIGIGA